MRPAPTIPIFWMRRGSASGMPTPRFARRSTGRRRRRTPAPAGLAGARRARPPRRGSPPRATTWRRPRSGRARGTGRARRRAPGRRAGRAPCGMTSATSERSASGRTLACALLDLLEEEARATRRGTRPARRARPRSPASNACGPVSIRFWRSGFSTMNFTACSAPTSCGTSCVPPQPGMRPRKTSGQAKWRTDDGDRPVVAVERDLDPAPERGAVDRGERDEGKVAQPAEELVACLASLARALGRDLAELVDVRADGEDERLSGEQEPAPVSRSQLAEHLLERAERLLAEGVRLLPVLAVVHRHERDRADARLDPLELELRSGASHRSATFSQRTAAPMPRPMQSAVRP